jgi:hypothetical protein
MKNDLVMVLTLLLTTGTLLGVSLIGMAAYLNTASKKRVQAALDEVRHLLDEDK